MDRKFIVIVLALIFTACKPEVDNSQQSIDDLFGSNDFEFHIQSPRYKSGSTILFTVAKKDTNYVLGSSQSHKGRFLSNKDLDDFKVLFSQLVASPKRNCQKGKYIFTIHAFNYSDAVEYKSCEDQWDKFEQILKLSEVLPK